MSRSTDEFCQKWVDSGLVQMEQAAAIVQELAILPVSADELAKALVQSGHLTPFQAKAIFDGKQSRLLIGNYAILKMIGAGGMGQVYLAEHRRMKRHVALKVLPTEIMKKPRAIERFHREVEAAARLNHPHIVNAYDAGEFKGLHFLVMEYVDGMDLRSLVRKQGPLSIDQTIRCIRQAASGLQYAHAQGVVHRDVTPGNLMIRRDRIVKVLDLGLASLSDTNGLVEHELTGTGVVVGTLDFLSPEQAMNTKNADARSDIYGLGCTLYFLLTGQTLFPGDSVVEKILAHREQPRPVLSEKRSDVPSNLETAYQRMVAKRPDNRFKAMADVVKALDGLLEDFARVSDSPNIASHVGVTASVDGRVTELASYGLQVVTEPQPDFPESDHLAATTATPEVALTDTTNSDCPSKIKTVEITPAAKTRRAPRHGQDKPPRKILPWLIGTGAILPILFGFILIRITNKDGTVMEVKVPSDSKLEISIEEGSDVLATSEAVITPDPNSTTTKIMPENIERTVAAWAQAKGAVVSVFWEKTGVEAGTIVPSAPLPTRPFRIFMITFQADNLSLTDSEVDKLVHLKHLSAISMLTQIDRDLLAKLSKIQRIKSIAGYTDRLPLTEVANFSRLNSLSLFGRTGQFDLAPLVQIKKLATLRIDQITASDIEVLSHCAGLRSVQVLKSANDFNEITLKALQEINGRVRIVTGERESPQCIGSDPTRESAEKLIDLGAKLQLRGFPKGSQHRSTDEYLASSLPFLIDRIEIPETVDVSEEFVELLDKVHISGSATVINRSLMNPLLSVIADQHELEVLMIKGSGPFDAEGLELLGRMVMLRHLEINVGELDLETLRRSLPYTRIQNGMNVFEPLADEMLFSSRR